MRRFYTLLLYLLLPYVAFHLLWRGRKQPGYRRHVGERFGYYPVAPQGTLRPQPSEAPSPSLPRQRGREQTIWLHTVSVGETRAAAPLIEALLRAYPQHRILLTHMTPTGRETGEQLFGNRVLRCYLPYDYPWAVRRFLRHFRPRVGLLLETEIWFNLVAECRAASVPLLLVNARMSAKSAHKFSRVPALTGPALAGLTRIAAQTEGDAVRLRELGAPEVEIMGNLKFDIAPPPAMIELGAVLRNRFGAQRPLFLAASTRDGEETLLLDALSGADIPGLLTVIVPRHPQRFAEVAQLLQARGIRYVRRSQLSPQPSPVSPERAALLPLSAGMPLAGTGGGQGGGKTEDGGALPPDTQIVLGDSMGELFAYYAACDVAYIGGSLLPYGGQNLIEAASLGKPALIGPHTYNFAEAGELAIAEGAALRVADGADLARELRRLFQDEPSRAAMARAGLNFSQRHRGATTRLMALIAPYLDA